MLRLRRGKSCVPRTMGWRGAAAAVKPRVGAAPHANTLCRSIFTWTGETLPKHESDLRCLGMPNERFLCRACVLPPQAIDRKINQSSRESGGRTSEAENWLSSLVASMKMVSALLAWSLRKLSRPINSGRWEIGSAAFSQWAWRRPVPSLLDSCCTNDTLEVQETVSRGHNDNTVYLKGSTYSPLCLWQERWFGVSGRASQGYGQKAAVLSHRKWRAGPGMAPQGSYAMGSCHH